MFNLGSSHSYYLYSQPTDMRKSFDSLSGLVRTHLKSDPFNGQVYVFINKQRNRIKLLLLCNYLHKSSNFTWLRWRLKKMKMSPLNGSLSSSKRQVRSNKHSVLGDRNISEKPEVGFDAGPDSNCLHQ